jgi:hypothetical protein
MARKNECPYDCGGYFIVRGNEKVWIEFLGFMQCFKKNLTTIFVYIFCVGYSYPRARLQEQNDSWGRPQRWDNMSGY